MRRYGLIAGALVVGLIVAACGGDEPSESPTQGAELFAVTFDEAGTWEEGVYSDDSGGPVSTLAIMDGRYQIDHRAGDSASFTWGAGGDAYENVVIEVLAEQLSSENDNLYGVMCRLAPDERGRMSGYALLISGDGHYGIAEFKGSSLDFVRDWHQSDHIRQGQAANTIRAICADDYLAVYANGEFLGDVKDDTYRRAGQVGLLAGVTGEESVRVAFDNLSVFEASIP